MEASELARKLDDDIDQFMEQLVAQRDRSSNEGVSSAPFDFDQWSKELSSHPFFAKDDNFLNEKSGKYDEAIEALQAMKYDENDDPIETAEQRKIEGNNHFKHKQYRTAIKCYTDGLCCKCVDHHLNSVLAANRAAAHFHLGNHRSAWLDSVLSLRFNPSNQKAVLRGAESLLRLSRAAKAVKWIDTMTSGIQAQIDEDEKLKSNLADLRMRAAEQSKLEARNDRMKHITAQKQLAYNRKLLTALQTRNILHEPELPAEAEKFSLDQLEVCIPQLNQVHRVDFDDSQPDTLNWPVLFCYPASGETDFIKSFNETVTFYDQMTSVLDSPAPWDPDHKYKPSTVRITFKDYPNAETRVAPMDSTLKDVLSSGKYCIHGGLPTFSIILK